MRTTSTACASYETTYAVPRFNNLGSQVTVLLLQNPTNYTITGTVYFWSATGTQPSARRRSTWRRRRSWCSRRRPSRPASGAMTIVHNGRYGDLSGKTVALEPATGFSFDSPMIPRVH